MSLNKGDTIGIIALSGDCDREKIEAAKKHLECLGYNVELSANIYDKNRYLAGEDSVKVKELHKFFKDKKIKLILCARGGYGAIRLIKKIDYKIIKSNPKPFCGFSDVTALLLMFYKKAGLITYHSPMASSDFSDISAFTEISFFTAINGNKMLFEGEKIYRDGKSKGILWGGNLATVVSLCGQDFIPDEDFIFFTEDINEPVYKIDRMFRQLINIDKFKKYCKGIVLGEFVGVNTSIINSKQKSEDPLKQLFEELADELKIPMTGGFKITHERNKITVPVGKQASLKGITLTV